MKEKHIQMLGVALTAFYGFFVAWIYVAAPKTLEEVPMKAQETIEKATTTAQVITNTYEVDRLKFEQGLNAFRQDSFIAARDAFERADPERRDARTQFYIAYSFYRQGFGRISSDDALFRQGLERLERVTQIDKNFRSDDEDLKLKTPAELRHELEEGLKVTVEDFNPFKVFRERK
jgi:Fibrinogen beta and gamma chains, C-terminal globular domain.